jgi:hypothetical protein
MAFGKKKVLEEPEVVVVDHTGWLLASSVAEFILMHTHEIKYMCMFGYTFYHGMLVPGVKSLRTYFTLLSIYIPFPLYVNMQAPMFLETWAKTLLCRSNSSI